MIKVTFIQEPKEAEVMMPAVPAKGDIVYAPGGISGRVMSVNWHMANFNDMFVKVFVDSVVR